MALGDDPYGTPVAEGDIQQAEAPDISGLAGQWRDWMAEPGNRQAIMQFGINLMQPVAQGQSAAGHFGQALGGAGEAVDRWQQTELREREQTRKEVDTGQKGEIGYWRAQSAQTTAEAARERAATQKAISAHRMDALEAQIKERAARVEEIKAKLAARPDPETAKRLATELMQADIEHKRANAEYRQEQKGAIMPGLAIQQQRADTGTAAQAATERQGDRAADQRDQGLALRAQELAAKQRVWTDATPAKRIELYQKYVDGESMWGRKPLSREQWMAREGLADAGTGAKPPPTGGGGGGAAPVRMTKPDGTVMQYNPAKGPKSDENSWDPVPK